MGPPAEGARHDVKAACTAPPTGSAPRCTSRSSSWVRVERVRDRGGRRRAQARHPSLPRPRGVRPRRPERHAHAHLPARRVARRVRSSPPRTTPARSRSPSTSARTDRSRTCVRAAVSVTRHALGGGGDGDGAAVAEERELVAGDLVGLRQLECGEVLLFLGADGGVGAAPRSVDANGPRAMASGRSRSTVRRTCCTRCRPTPAGRELQRERAAGDRGRDRVARVEAVTSQITAQRLRHRRGAVDEQATARAGRQGERGPLMRQRPTAHERGQVLRLHLARRAFARDQVLTPSFVIVMREPLVVYELL